jgi:hypothetical protein
MSIQYRSLPLQSTQCSPPGERFFGVGNCHIQGSRAALGDGLARKGGVKLYLSAGSEVPVWRAFGPPGESDVQGRDRTAKPAVFGWVLVIRDPSGTVAWAAFDLINRGAGAWVVQGGSSPYG